MVGEDGRGRSLPGGCVKATVRYHDLSFSPPQRVCPVRSKYHRTTCGWATLHEWHAVFDNARRTSANDNITSLTSRTASLDAAFPIVAILCLPSLVTDQPAISGLVCYGDGQIAKDRQVFPGASDSPGTRRRAGAHFSRDAPPRSHV